MFRRTQPELPPDQVESKSGQTPGKGRPTPTRKESEAAAKARAKAPRTRKEKAAAQRQGRTESSQRIRQGMREGDERYLLERDKGPVRRFVRDFVDTRFNVSELAIPLFVVAIAIQYLVSPAFSSAFLLAVILVVVVELVLLRRKVRRAVAERFPDESLKGLTYYTLARATQMRFMRLPKPQLKRGDPLPERYR